MTHIEPDPVPTVRPLRRIPPPGPAAAPDRPAGPTTLRSVEDVLAYVPVLFGFRPAASLVMLTVGAPRNFHARLDLGPRPGLTARQTLVADVDELVRIARRHGAPRLLFVVYTDDPRLARRVCERLETVLARTEVRIVDVVRADGDRWWPLVGPARALVPPDGHEVDLRGHPLLAEAVLRGEVVLGSREELAASLAPVPSRSAPVADRLEPRPTRTPSPAPPEHLETLGLMIDWVADLVGRCVADQPLASPERDWRPTDDEVSELLVALHWPQVRDAAMTGLDRGSARAHLRLWREVLQRTPQPWAAEPAALLALAAWHSGHGALAWCAVDRARSVDPEHGLAGVVAHLLEHAAPPPQEGLFPA
ncbi:DUF4192 domain-containing protein [Nocardioides nanhaiensis]|uniref:DUF4192 domain-containing protein n=1 Tax=Nocardioides nanhaiensis TaxID=1476871 RepID=A0ABP8X276_9ACTN